jgi:hypothetical protein
MLNMFVDFFFFTGELLGPINYKLLEGQFYSYFLWSIFCEQAYCGGKLTVGEFFPGCQFCLVTYGKFFSSSVCPGKLSGFSTVEFAVLKIHLSSIHCLCQVSLLW